MTRESPEPEQLLEPMISISIRELVPIVRLEGHPIGSGRPGALAVKLLEAFHARTLRDTPTDSREETAAARVGG